MSDDLVCAGCHGTEGVRLVSPDLDVAPVPLCRLCRVAILWDARIEGSGVTK